MTPLSPVVPKAALGTAFPLAGTSTRTGKETNTGQEGHSISRWERNSTCLIYLFPFQKENISKVKQRARVWQASLETTSSARLPAKEGNSTFHLGTTDGFRGDMEWGVAWGLNKSRTQETEPCLWSASCVSGFLLNAQVHSMGPHSKQGDSLSPFINKLSTDNPRL